MGSILEEIEKTVSKQPESRTDEEVTRLLPWFRKKSDVFQSLKSDAVVDIIKNCDMIRKPKDSVIIKQNDKGNSFFIILSGRVSVYISTKDEDDDVDDERERASESDQALGLPSHQDINSSLNVKDITGTLTEISQSISDSKRASLEAVVEAFHLPLIPGGQNLDRSKYGQYVAGIGDGKSFGELALLKKNCVRNATIITDTSCQLLVVDRQLYNRCIRESQEKEFMAKQMFVHTSEYFDGWNLRSKRQLAMSLHLRTYTYGTPVVCQGQPLDYIYFLRSGQCKVMIDASMHRTQYPCYSADLEKMANKFREAKLESKHESTQAGRRKKMGITSNGYDICLIGECNMIGDIELSTNLSTYMQTVTCEQYTEAFAIDLRNYDRLVTRRHAYTGRFIAQNSLLKLDNRAQRFPNIPLLRIVADRFARLRVEFLRTKRLREESRRLKKARTLANARRKTNIQQHRLPEIRGPLSGHTLMKKSIKSQ